MRLWILFVCGVLILGAAIWPFSRKTEQLAPVPAPPMVAVKSTAPEPPKPEPAKIVEVIDLARAYEPVREPEEPAGGVDPATFIEVPERAKPIPPAGELIDVMPRELEELRSLPERTYRSGERLDVLPREVPQNPYRGLLDEINIAAISPVWLYDTPAWNEDGTAAHWPAWDVAIDPNWSQQQQHSNFIRAFRWPAGLFMNNERLPDQFIAVRSMIGAADRVERVGRRVSLDDFITRLDVMPREVK